MSWLTINQNTGALTGTPTGVENDTVVVSIVDSLGRTTYARLPLAVNTPVVGPQFGVSISGNQFINNLTGQPIQLRGVNISGNEHMPAEVSPVSGGNSFAQNSGWGTNLPPFNMLVSSGAWPSNCVRCPVNQAAWLGQIVGDTTGTVSSNYYKADPQGTYHAQIDAFVQACKTNNLYCIIDLHWSLPSNLAGVASGQQQNYFLDADNSPTFWASMAAYAKDKPWVILELFNEPIISNWAQMMSTGTTFTQTGGAGTAVYNCMLLQAAGRSGNFVPCAFSTPGGTVPADTITSGSASARVVYYDINRNRIWYDNVSGSFASGNVITGSRSGAVATISNPNVGWATSTFQACLNAVRATGATNVVLISSSWYSHDFDNWGGTGGSWLANKPTDPTPAGYAGTWQPQIAANGHWYSGDQGAVGSKAYIEGQPFINTKPAAAAILAAGIPVIIDEYGDQNSSAAAGAPAMQYVTQWVDAHRCSALAWTFNPWGNSDDVLLQNTNGTATIGEGVFFQNWLKWQKEGHGVETSISRGIVSGIGYPGPVPTPTVSSGTASALFGSPTNFLGAYRSSGVCTIAFDISYTTAAGATAILMAWYSDLSNYDFDGYADGPQTFFNCPGTYQIQTNTAAGGGAAPTSGWVTVKTVSNPYTGPTLNPLNQRADLIPVSSTINWLRYNFTAVNGSSGNSDIQITVDLYDGTGVALDGHFFVGDSKVANCMAKSAITGSTPLAFPDICHTGGFITTLGTLVGGSGYTNGTHNTVALTGGSGSNAFGTVTVAGGAVTAVAVACPGYGYQVNDTLSIGGGTGGTIKVTAVQGAQRYNGYFPLQIAGGQGGWKAGDNDGADWARYCTVTYPNVFNDFPGKYVWINLGTNPSASTSSFQTGLQTIINAAQAAGKIVILEKIDLSPNESQIASYNTVIQNLYASNPAVIPGPDFSAIPLNYSDGIHPDSNGQITQRIVRAKFACNLISPAPSLAAGPTNVELLLQGQAKQGDSPDTQGTGSPANRFQPSHPNQLTVGWKSVAGATSYNLYRSVDQGPYSTTPYATVTAAAATTNYNSYVSNSSGAPFISSAFVDSAYTDLAATQCVPYPKGSAPNWYSNGHGYGYKVTAVVGGVETAKSSAMTASLYRYGTRIMLLDSFNPIGSNNPNYAATDGGVTPSGATQTMKVSPGGQTYINPYCGNGCPEWLMETKQFNYMVFVIKGTPNHFPVMWPEVVGDYSYQLLNHGGGTSISSGTWSSTTYTTVKVALGGPSGLMTDYTSGAAVRLSAWYKCTLDAQASGTYWIADWYFSET